MNIDIIIPIYKPDQSLFCQLELLKRQTCPPRKVILMNTEEKYFEKLVYGSHKLEAYKNFIQVRHLSKREYDHGGTRNAGAALSDAQILVFMTQDAMPEDEKLIECLVKPFMADEGKLAVTYARQLPGADSSILEIFTRNFNYPDKSVTKTLSDLERLGIKTYFCSNVCAAYRRDIFEALHGFVDHTIFNEDMLYAAKAMKEGYAIRYTAQARVIHSHNYNCGQQFRRNFDLGVSQADHPEVFAGVSSEAEGKRLVRDAVAYLKKEKRIGEIPYFFAQCVCKYAGYRLGKQYRRLPGWMILRCTSNKEYWAK